DVAHGVSRIISNASKRGEPLREGRLWRSRRSGRRGRVGGVGSTLTGRAGMSRFDDVICATPKPFAQRLTPLRYEAALWSSRTVYTTKRLTPLRYEAALL